MACLAMSADGRVLVSCSGGRSLRLRDAEGRKAIGEPLRGHEDSVQCMAKSGNGRTVVSGSWDKTVRL